MERSLRTLKGVGEKTEKLFQKIGANTVDDLLRYYPRSYDAYEEPVEINSLTEGSVAAVQAAVITSVYVNQIRNLQVITVTAADSTGKLSITWYNAPYLRSSLKKGSCFVFRGRMAKKQGKLVMEHPEIFTPAAYEEILHSLQPIYSLTAGLSNKTIVKLLKQVLKEQPLSMEFLPVEIKERYHLADDNYAISTIHFPPDMQQLLQARKRLVFDEFLLFILSVQMLKEKTEEAKNAFPMKPVWTTEQVIESLPYQLTKAQLNVWHEIERDMCGHPLMSRLVQGDVGSGKTILAFLAMILAVENGYQAALMVPTEVLANQHFEAFANLMREQGISSCHPVLLTGSTTAREKRRIYEEISSGEANIIIGTHALIQEKVIYQNLGLVITDEQHRFGVRQRETFAEKGTRPHILVMSATPIPRTLSLILYGDMDISVVDEVPARRLPIKNCVVNTAYRPKAYAFIADEVKKGHQAYVICPLVEASEEAQGENVIDYSKTLMEELPSGIQVGVLHGKMKSSKKNEIMQEFAENKIQVLVSTTVVEVGVNVPNATVMLIENADRFGLAQLHQLRGRVGRGDAQSYCIMINGSNSKQAEKRLSILNHSNDGFFIASEDLKLRGPGDFFGIRQSGDIQFKLGDIYQDADLLQKASELCDELLEEDAAFSSEKNAGLKKRLEHYQKEQFQKLNL